MIALALHKRTSWRLGSVTLSPKKGLGAFAYAFDDPSESYPDQVEITWGHFLHRCGYSCVAFAILAVLSVTALIVRATLGRDHRRP